jgi:thioesterase domain-containing protein
MSDPASMEDIVAAAWEQALSRQSIDRNADFRDLRVNTNRGLRIVRNIWSATSIELPVNIFFAAPTIARMAATILSGDPIPDASTVRLRDGDETAPLFLFAGGIGVLLELGDLVGTLDYPGAVYGIPFSGLDGIGPIHRTAELEAEHARNAIRRLQKSGPYRLVGYSFGGIIALEVARQLRAPGDEVFVGMIDSAQNDHAWPFQVWLAFMARRVGRKLRRSFSKLPRLVMRRATGHSIDKSTEAGPAYSERRQRGTQLEFRFRNPDKPDYPYYHPSWRGGYPPNYGEVAKNTCRMHARYTPEEYGGEVTFFASVGGDPLVCDPREVWPVYLPNAEWVRVPGNHLSMMVGRNAAVLACEISQRLKRIEPPAPRRSEEIASLEPIISVCQTEAMAK